MALIIADPSVPFNETHAAVYTIAAAQMPPRDFAALSQRQPLLMQSQEVFKKILRYYEIKPAYILIARAFHALGFNLVSATYLPSIVSYFFIGCLLFVWLQKMLDIQFAALATLMIAGCPFLITPARYSSPDMLCAAISFAGLFFISEISVAVGLILCLLAIPIRPDIGILFICLIPAIYIGKKLTLNKALTFGAMVMAGTLLVLGNLELLKEFLFTIPSYSSSWNNSEMIKNYGTGLRSGLNSIVNSNTFILSFLAITTLYLNSKQNQKILLDFWSLLTIGALATFMVRFLLHPIIEDRFQVPAYLIIIIGFCKYIGNQGPMNKARIIIPELKNSARY